MFIFIHLFVHLYVPISIFFFFFQAEDGIRDRLVTGVQTCALPICPGASGMIGTEIFAKMEPDGHALLGHTSSYPATASVRAKLPFDPARAIVPVATLAKAPMLMAVHPSVPAKSVKELIAVAKRTPGGLNYGSSGAGGNNHFSGSLFAAAAGIKMTHVPYKGISMATAALASGEIESVIASAA